MGPYNHFIYSHFGKVSCIAASRFHPGHIATINPITAVSTIIAVSLSKDRLSGLLCLNRSLEGTMALRVVMALVIGLSAPLTGRLHLDRTARGKRASWVATASISDHLWLSS